MPLFKLSTLFKLKQLLFTFNLVNPAKLQQNGAVNVLLVELYWLPSESPKIPKIELSSSPFSFAYLFFQIANPIHQKL